MFAIIQCQQWALEIHEKLGAPFELMQSLNAVAVVRNLLGDLAGARAYYERALALARESSSPRIQDFLNATFLKKMMLSVRTGTSMSFFIACASIWWWIAT